MLFFAATEQKCYVYIQNQGFPWASSPGMGGGQSPATARAADVLQTTLDLLPTWAAPAFTA